jgi:hypothetical protein
MIYRWQPQSIAFQYDKSCPVYPTAKNIAWDRFLKNPVKVLAMQSVCWASALLK